MGQIWAAIKSLGVIAELVRELLKWVREIQHKRAIDKADEHHEKNAADIDAAFGGRVPEPAANQPRPASPGSPAVPGRETGGP